MKNLISLSLAALALGLAACDSGSDSFATATPPTPSFDLQVLHASPDAPAVDVVVRGNTVLSGVDYKQGSGRFQFLEGSLNIAVEGILPTGNVPVIGPVDLDFSGNNIYTVVAVNDVANIGPVIVEQPRTAVSAGAARLNVLHAAAAAPEVDVFVTTPGADLSATAPVGTFSFQETIGPAEVTAGDYQIRVTPAGDPATVVFDSGTIALADGSDLFVAAVPNTSGGAAPISLVVLTGSGSAEILDADTPASLRVFHKSADAPAVDVVVNDDFAAPLIEDLSFPNFVGYVGVPVADYNVKVAPANSTNFVIEADLSLAAGQTYDVLAVGDLATIEPLVLNDDPRVVNTEAKVRIVHASPTAQDVDIYVAAPGTDIATIAPAFAGVPFRGSTGYVSLPADADGESFEVTVVPAGTTTPAIGPAVFNFFAGDVLTVVARDAVGGGAPLDVIIANDTTDE